MFGFYNTMLIQRLIQSIRNAPGVILRLLRAVLLPMVLRGAGIISKFLHFRLNSPTSPCMMCEPSQRGPSCSVVAAALVPDSLTGVLPLGTHDDFPDDLSPSMPSAVYALDIPLSERHVTSVTTLDIIPAAPEQIQRYLRRRPMYV